MPISHVFLRAGKPEAYRKAILDGLGRALSDALGVSEDNRFMTLSEHEPANFRHGNAYGVTRSDDVVYIRITVFDSRSATQKQALFRRLAELLAESPGLRGEDLFVNIVDSPKENWSVGHGLAQFA
jgi:4-oxalocrotonate tautomerase